ncbi:hypothetical protein SGRIM128S_06982 [Streptomyces griseomycini]
MGKPGRGLIPQAGDDAEKVTALAVKRTRRYLAEVRKRYPDAFAQLNRMVRQKGAPGMPDWPDWCWLPMGASYAVASGGGLNRLTATDPRTADMGRLAALAAWRLTKGVYWLEADAQDRHIRRLWKAPGVPADPVLRQERYTGGMPQHCVYVALPQRNRPTQVGPLPWPLGVFIHLEHDVNNGRPELRIVVDTDGTWEGLAPHPVMLTGRRSWPPAVKGRTSPSPRCCSTSPAWGTTRTPRRRWRSSLRRCRSRCGPSSRRSRTRT